MTKATDLERQTRFLHALESAASSERWAAHKNNSAADNCTIASFYAWNVALCEALYPALHAVEITLRNRLYGAGVVHFKNRVSDYFEVNCWLDAKPRLLLPAQLTYIVGAKDGLRSRLQRKFKGSPKSADLVKAHMTPSRLIAELHFGFWTYLFDAAYAGAPNKQGLLWPTLLPIVFPLNPAIKRHEASRRLSSVRQLRNSIFHHETIWDRPNLAKEYSEAVELLSWMSPEAASLLKEFSQFPDVYQAPPSDPHAVPRTLRMQIRNLAIR